MTPLDRQTDNHQSHKSARGASESWLFWALMLVIALAPLPLGSNRPLPIAIWSGCIGLLIMTWGGFLLRGSQRFTKPSRLVVMALICFTLTMIWIFLQWLPWGPSDPMWGVANQVLNTELAGRISVNPEATLTGLMHLLSYAGIFWLSLQLNGSTERARTSIRSIMLIGAAYALYGIISFFSGDEWILFYRKWTYFGSLTSTFVNRNSYATFAGLCLLCGTVYLIDRLRPIMSLKQSWRAKFVMLVEETAARSLWITFCVITIALSLLLSNSRGGTGATVVGLTCLLGIYLWQRRVRVGPLLITISIIVATAGIIYGASGNKISQRLVEPQVEQSLEYRTQYYGQIISAIKSSPWTGTGLGTFEDVFTAYRTPERPDLSHWDKAHNTYLENALELGIPAAMLLNLSLLLLAWEALQGVRRRKREKLLPAIGLAASLLVGLHSLVDFSLQIPAVTMLYAYIMGLAVSQARGRSSS